MKNGYVKLFWWEIITVLAIFLAGYIGSLIYDWFGMTWMVIYIVVLAIVVGITLGKWLES